MSKETLRYGEESGTQLQFHTGTAAGTQKRPAMFHGHAVDAEENKRDPSKRLENNRFLKKIFFGNRRWVVFETIE